jgi:serine/threonine-protein kinase
MPNPSETPRNPKKGQRRGAAKLEQKFLSAATQEGSGFISGPPSVHIRSARLDMSEIVSERFEPRRCIDSRGEQLVCVAYDRVENREVTLKVRRVHDRHENTDLGDLKREAMIGKFLPVHANVIELYDLYHLLDVNGRPLVLLSMEYADGGSLRQWLQQQTSMSPEVKVVGLEHLRSLCLGVSVLHKSGIVHLDLKPENALICSGVVKVSDFGAAHVFGNLQQANGDEQVPPPSASGGTANYMSPEQFTVRHVNEMTRASDIYALGVILFEILNPNHRPPFIGSYQQLCRLHQTAPVPVLTTFSPREAEIIACCMAKDPRERFVSVDELVVAIGSLFPTGTPLEPTDQSDGNGGSHVSRQDTVDENQGKAHRDAATALYEQVINGMEDGDLDELLEVAAKAEELCPDHPLGRDTKSRLARRVEAFTGNIAACKSELEASRLDSALLAAKQAVAANPASTAAAQMVTRVTQAQEYVKRLQSEMKTAASALDFDRALSIAKQLDDMGIPADGELVIGGQEQ